MSVRSRHSCAGQALVETAIVMPVLLALLFGLNSIWRAAHFRITLLQAARYGAAVEARGGSGAKAVREYLNEQWRSEHGVVDSIDADYSWPLARVRIVGRVPLVGAGGNTVGVKVTAGVGGRVGR